MTDPLPTSSESTAPTSRVATDSGDTRAAPARKYQLTVKRGFLAWCIMFACQTLVGVCFSYGARSIWGANAVHLATIGMASVLIGGSLVLLWVWSDIRRFGPEFLPQIGWQRGAIETRQIVMLVLLLLTATHFFAWTYRSVILPLWGHGGIVGGGSQLFVDIKATGSALRMAGFFLLALVVGPVMEEVVFRGYLQSALARRMPAWFAVTLTSVLFMLGHGPAVLWPMYFIYSVAWGWIFMQTQSLRAAIAIHVLSNLFYAIVAVMDWKILA